MTLWDRKRGSFLILQIRIRTGFTTPRSREAVMSLSKIKGRKFVANIKVVNDVAERGVKLYSAIVKPSGFNAPETDAVYPLGHLIGSVVLK